jgi:hypothetical protein
VSDAALIEMPDGSPGAVSDAGTSLQRVAGGFERGGGVVARASSAVTGWQGQASVSFNGRAASYGIAMVAVDDALTAARVAVRRYEAALEDARARIRRLREQEEMAVERLERAKVQLEEAQGRLAGAQQRMSAASFNIGLSEPFAISESVQAGRDADAAQADIDAAQKQIDREREEIRELREDARRERTALVEAEQDAAGTVRAAAGRLPDVQLPGGAASPSAYAGTLFAAPVSPLARDPRWASSMSKAAADDEPEEPGFFAKAWDHAMDNFGQGTPLQAPLALADEVSPGFRSDFGRAVTEDLATGLYDTGKMGVQLSLGYSLIDPAGSDRAARQAQAIIDYAREDPAGFAKDASGWSAVEAGHPGTFAGQWSLAAIPGGAGVKALTTTGKVMPDATPPISRADLDVPESPPYQRELLPELQGSERDAFTNGAYEVRTEQAGTRYYRSEAAGAKFPGGWLGEEPALTKGGAEALYNVAKWDNPLEVMREYRLRHDLTVYAGKVDGGTGQQVLVPPDIPREHLLELLQPANEWKLP